MSSTELKGNGNKRKGGFFRWFWRNRRIQVIFLLLVISIPVFMIVYGIVLPTRNYKPSTATGMELPEPAHDGSVSLTSEQESQVKEIIRLENEKAYQAARLSLSNKDSVYFVLSMPDSAIILEIKGVPVRVNKFVASEISNRFSLISHENLLPWIAEPFLLESDESTIPKSPIVVKQAPKDTIEAQKANTGPVIPDSTDVYYTLYFDRNLVIEVEQANPMGKGNVQKVQEYLEAKKHEARRTVIQTLKNPQQANQPLHIRIVLNEADAKAIFRAIPENSHLILRL